MSSPLTNLQPTWLTAKQTFDRVSAIVSIDRAQHVLLNRCRDGLMRTWAHRLIMDGEVSEKHELDADVWSGFLAGTGSIDWGVGDFTSYSNPFEYTVSYLRVYGVKFCKQDIDDFLPNAAVSSNGSTQIESSIVPLAKGRPRSENWNRLTVEVARLIYIGDLQPPVDQSKTRDALLAWLDEQGVTLDRTTVDPFFRLLTSVLNAEAGKKD